MKSPPPIVVADRYELGEVVGRGGYGMVCRAWDRHAGRAVAVKVLSPGAGRDPHFIERMLREQQAMVAMAGTCAVTAIDLCRLPSGGPCLVMEWLDGWDLEHQFSMWEAENERPSAERILEIVHPLAETLHRAHQIGIVHRDIKPANIFLTSGAEPRLRLLDFGLSRMQSAAPLTAVGVVMGSPSYIAPEVWLGNSATVNHQADLYSLAVIVFRALTGQLPFDTPSLLGKLAVVTTAPRPTVSSLRKGLAPGVDEWMKRALAIDPKERFQSARDFYATLLSALLHAPPAAANGAAANGASTVALAASVAPSEKQSVLRIAWEAAKSLVQRFTGQPEMTPGPDSRPSSVTVPPADQRSLWLDPSDLEDSSSDEPRPDETRDPHEPAVEMAASPSPTTPKARVAKKKAKAHAQPGKANRPVKKRSRKAASQASATTRVGTKKTSKVTTAAPSRRKSTSGRTIKKRARTSGKS